MRMMIPGIRVRHTMTLGLMAVVASATTAAPVVVKPGLPLIFPDDGQISTRTNIVRVFHPAKKDPKEMVPNGEVYGSVNRLDDGSLRMWYNCGYGMYVADSADGGHSWTLPTLSSNGANRVHGDIHSPTVLLDRFEKDDARKFKCIGTRIRMIGWNVLDRKYSGYYAMTSPDGIHWSAGRKVAEGWDTATLLQHPATGEFFLYHKDMKPLPGRDEIRRFVLVAHSTDFEHWSTPEIALAPDEADDEAWIDTPDQRTDFYNMSVFAHAGGFIGFTTVFRIPWRIPLDKNLKFQHDSAFIMDDGDIEVQLATSADGLHFVRTPGRRAMIPAGKTGERDVQIDGIAGGELLSDDKETWVYYCGFNLGHAMQFSKQPSKNAHVGIYRAFWRRWGFSSLGSSTRGIFVTKPLSLATGDVRINSAPVFDPFRGAKGAPFVKLTVLAADEDEVLAESDDIRGDQTLGKVVWMTTPPPTNRMIRLRIELRASEVYAIECL